VDIELSRKPLKVKGSKASTAEKGASGTKGQDKGKAEGAEGGKGELIITHEPGGTSSTTRSVS